MLTTVVVLLPLLAEVLAAPHLRRSPGQGIEINKRSRLANDDGTVNLDFLQIHRSNVIRKYERGMHAWHRNSNGRYGRLSKRDTGAVPLVDEASQLWYGYVTVGTPPVEYKVDFDTGSSDLFLPGSNCVKHCKGHTRYDPSKSSTSKNLGKTFTLQYGDGSSVKGEQYTDNAGIAGFNVTGQTLGAAKDYSDGFSHHNYAPDGLLGMAFQSISEYNAPPLFQNLVSKGLTTSPVFAFKFSTNGSELFIGGTNDALHNGDFTYTKVLQEAYWQVALESVNVGGTPAVNNLTSIIDSGTTLIVGDSAAVAQMYAAVPGAKNASDSVGAGFYTFPCSSVPAISLSFSGRAFDVSAETFNLGNVNANSTDCVGGVVGGDVGDAGWIVGDVFLQNVYTAFDFGNKQVGFATLA